MTKKATSLLALALMLAAGVSFQNDSGEAVRLVGVIEPAEALGNLQHGTHGMTDQVSETLYALRSDVVDLDAYLGEPVIVYGTTRPEYEANVPPLVFVEEVRLPRGETVTVTFELTVEGEPPEDATFFGYLGYEPAPFQLTDPDGDAVYTGRTPEGLVPAGDTQPSWMVQGTGTRRDYAVGQSPGEPSRVLEDFGEVTFEEDTTLSASVSFEESREGSGGFPGDVANAIRSFLPVTGVTLTVVVAGVLLIGGLLFRRLFR